MSDATITWAVASRPMRGQTVSGDLATVQHSGGRWVLAVIDGLGHGPEAAVAARQAAAVVEHHPGEPLDALLLLTHQELRDSRGAVATIALVDQHTGLMSWMGIGNVDGVVIRADREARPRNLGVFLVGGVLGHQMQRLHSPTPVQLTTGDLVVMATDGIRANLAEAVQPELSNERLAETMLADHSRPDDDALVLVARFGGPGS